MKRNILLHPDPRLKKTATPVADLSDGLRRLADDMVETMYAAPGIGLAAPQVGVLERLIVLDCTPDDSAERGLLVMFNPQIIAQSEDTSSYEEGCLSIPEVFDNIQRPAEVRVSYLDRLGKQHEEVYDGLMATVLQHEIDHLNGILFIDHLPLLKQKMIKKRLTKLASDEA